MTSALHLWSDVNCNASNCHYSTFIVFLWCSGAIYIITTSVYLLQKKFCWRFKNRLWFSKNAAFFTHFEHSKPMYSILVRISYKMTKIQQPAEIFLEVLWKNEGHFRGVGRVDLSDKKRIMVIRHVVIALWCLKWCPSKTLSLGCRAISENDLFACTQFLTRMEEDDQSDTTVE